VPDLVQALDDVPGGAPVNDQQRAAVEATGEVFVSAGAGTGKTTVLVERFVRAVCEQGLDVESVLVITYTRKAAGELRARIRAALHARGRHDLARRLDGAWISTIHGFCSRLLRAHPFSVGIDPRFRELDDEHGAVIRGEAFERALADFCAGRDSERLRLLATYGANGLRRMLTGVYETLRSAGRDLKLELGEQTGVPERLAELKTAAQSLAADSDVTENQLASANAALALGSNPEQLLDLELAASGDRAAEFRAARDRLQQAALEELAARDSELLQELLDLFAAEYAAAKQRESALDFEDLQLLARDLLRDDEHVREAEQLRFRAIMVDEFQDTNRLQCDVVDLLRGAAESHGLGAPDVFFVGDEFQSIYGFRHADVAVFRDRRQAAEQRLPLARNYRSRPEVLAAVNHLFGGEFGDGYQPLAASGEFADPVFGHPVELLVSDKRTYREAGENWREGEAQAIARRVSDLVETGSAAPGEIVLLFAAGTDAERYESALRERGLPTYRATGRGYFGQQQVVDLLSYLRLLHNRYDDEALATVLASPFVGVSNDALVLIRRHGGRRPLYTGIERSLPEADERLVRAFKQRYERLAAASAHLPLERLCEEIVSAHDYDLAVLAQWDGKRRYANLRKLMRLARSYEELRGADIEGFVRFIRDQQAVGASQLEAVSEEEGADAVRLLTIHAAKGLEFKVVIVADAGRDMAGAPSTDEILVGTDGSFGFRVIDPKSGKRKGVFKYEDVREAEKRDDRAERLRLYYVAMTRAIDRLIVSGAIDPDRPQDRETPIGWVLARLGAEAEVEAAAAEPVELERGEARFVLAVDRWAPRLPGAEPVPADDAGQLALFAELPAKLAPRGYRLPELLPLPAPPLHRVRRLSYSALALFERCSYRYYVERVAGLREERGTVPGAKGLKATEVGDAVHRLLELVDLAAPAPVEVEIVRSPGWYPAVSDEELARIAGFVASYCNSELAARIATLGGAQPERPFAFEHDGVLLHGRLDVLWRDGPRALVLDYKTNSLAEAGPEEIVEADYRLQRLVYALACFRAGADEVEVVYHFLERPDAVVATSFIRDELPSLEAELSAAIARIDAGEFVPTPSDFTCSGCPALDLVCAGPKLRQAPARLVAAV